MPIKLFQDGEILDASEVNTYFMDQALIVFDDSAQRDAAFGGSGEPVLQEGRICYLKSDDTIYIYTGAAWTAQLATIADSAITTAKLDGTSGSEAVTTAKIRDNAITEAKIGSGAVTTAKLGSSLSLTTPTLGVASATSINKVAITAPASSATLTLANGSSLITSGAFSITLTGTATTNVTLPTTGTLATIAGSETLTNKTLTSPVITNPTITGFTLGDSSIVFEGSSADDFETTLTVVNPTADRTITLPNVSGTVITNGDTATISNTMINYATVPQQTVSTSAPSGGKQHDIWIRVA